MSKPRLEVFLDRILFESITTKRFLAFTVEITTLKAPIEYFGRMINCVDDFSWKMWVFSISSVFLDYVDEKRSTFYGVPLSII